MNKLSLSVAAAVLMGAAGAAFAQFNNPGDIIFTTTNGGEIRNISGAGFGPSVTLWTSPEAADASFENIDRAPNGAFYIADGRNTQPPPNTTDSGIVRVDDLFGTPSGSYITRGNPLQNPTGLKYDRTTNRLLTVSNPGSPTTPDHIEGIFSVSLDGSVVEQIYDQPTILDPSQPPRPRWEAGTFLAADPDSNDWWSASVGGGVDTGLPGPNGTASTITRLRYDAVGNTYNLDDSPTTIDLSQSFTGASQTYTNLRDLVVRPGPNGGTDIYFTEIFADYPSRDLEE